MRASARGPGRVGIRCDAGISMGVGHLVRCVALAEELTSRGLEVVFFSDLGGVVFAERELLRRGLRWTSPPAGPQAFLDAVRTERLDAVVVDSYSLPTAVTETLVAADVPVLAIVDGELRGQRAHLYLDQNIGAENDNVPLPDAARRIAGTRYALLRDSVRQLRPARPWSPRSAVPSVVVAFGGTDTSGMTAIAVRALVASGALFHARVVTADAEVRAGLTDLRLPAASRIVACEPFNDFPRVLAQADLVVGAAGTSAWEYCCLGVPAAVAAVVDNQTQSYGRLVASGAVLPLGNLVGPTAATGEAFVDALSHALVDQLARQSAAAAAHALVDGNGRARAVDALLAVASLHGGA
jgi:spore coat polysaccharide biosynthesis predicted glycosyltransferase SpsG